MSAEAVLTEEEEYQAEYDKAFDSIDEEPSKEETVVEEETVETEEVVEEEIAEPTEDSEFSEEETEVEQPKEDSKEDTTNVIYNGAEIPLTKEELRLMAQRGIDYTKKTQELSEWKGSIKTLKENGISNEQLSILSDILKGDKNALAALAKQANIDTDEVEYNETYKPKVDNTNYEVEEVIEELKSFGVSDKVGTYIGKLPNAAQDMILSNPNILKGFGMDVRNGIAEKIMPIVNKQMMLNPTADFVETYRNIGKAYFEQNNEKVKTENIVEKKVDPVTAEMRKKASAPKSKPVQNKPSYLDDADSIWDNDDMFKNIQKKMRGY